jgi:hypothetical protein
MGEPEPVPDSVWPIVGFDILLQLAVECDERWSILGARVLVPASTEEHEEVACHLLIFTRLRLAGAPKQVLQSLEVETLLCEGSTEILHSHQSLRPVELADDRRTIQRLKGLWSPTPRDVDPLQEVIPMSVPPAGNVGNRIAQPLLICGLPASIDILLKEIVMSVGDVYRLRILSQRVEQRLQVR